MSLELIEADMEEDLDDALMFETLAATLQLDRKEARSLVESLANMLQGALPEQVTITRGGWLMSKDKPVEELLVKFDATHYQIVKQKGGSAYSAKAMKIVRGIALKSTELELADCVSKIVEEVSVLAGKSSRMKMALNKFITG
ncbi:MAG: hypothetical protein K2X81_20690 [Candidatus Obscuribacterales bacterium]|nr:hypothetical protein [Candidatus Obscuribacterales bacterium]